MKILKRTLPTSLLSTLCAVSCCLYSLSAIAQPDLSGYWTISNGKIPPNRTATPLEQSMLDALPKETKILADSGLVEFAPGDFGGLDITPEAKAKADKYDLEVQRSVSTTCRPPSIIYSMQGPFPLEIFQGHDLIVIKMEYFDVVRIIFMNQQTHPDTWPLSVTGHSIGHWEKNTLVVDTTQIQSSTMLNNGLDHSSKLHLVERFKLSDDGKALVLTQEYDDPTVFKGHAARLIPLNKGKPTEHVYPYDCDPNYGNDILNRVQ